MCPLKMTVDQALALSHMYISMSCYFSYDDADAVTSCVKGVTLPKCAACGNVVKYDRASTRQVV